MKSKIEFIKGDIKWYIVIMNSEDWKFKDFKNIVV